MGTEIRSFSPLPRNVSLEDLVPKDHFYRRLEERLDLSFVSELVEVHANPSLLSPTRLPTRKDAAASYSWPKDGCLPRWRGLSTTIGSYAKCWSSKGNYL